MYEEFFGFAGSPFRLNPDPKFFFGSRSHNKAMAYLHYGLRQAEGFIVITGEIGAGKSMLIGHLLDQLDRTNVVAANLLTSSLESDALLSHILSAFRIEPAGTGKSAEIEAFEDFLFDQMNRGRRVLLIVDEAQNLPIRTLEELRVLSNMDYDGTPLFQVFLVGQPEFRATLARANMEQLRQRVIATYHLEPLDAEETRDYIQHRLSLVGWANDPAIDTPAYARLHAATEGVPRKINTLANRVLLYCALEGLHAIDAQVVDTVFADYTRDEFGKDAAEENAEPVAPKSPARSASDPLTAALAAAAEAEAALKAADEARKAEEAAEQARVEADARAKAEQAAKARAEEQARAEAEAKAQALARKEADAKNKADAEARARSKAAAREQAPAAKNMSTDKPTNSGPDSDKEGVMAKEPKSKSASKEAAPGVKAAGPVSVLDRLRAQREAEASAATPAASPKEEPSPPPAAAWAAAPAPEAKRERAADAPAPATLVDVAQAIAAASAAARNGGSAPAEPALEADGAEETADSGTLAADPRGWRHAVVRSINETRDELKSAHTSVARLRRQLSDLDRRREERRVKIAGSLARAESLLADIRNAWR